MVKKDVKSIVNELKSLAEEKKSEMSANVYEYIWNMIQGIEHEETKDSTRGCWNPSCSKRGMNNKCINGTGYCSGRMEHHKD